MKPIWLLLGLTLALAGCQARTENDPVVVAVALNDEQAVRAYLEGGGDVHRKSRDGDPLIYIASGPRGGREVLALLLASGADPDAPSADGRTPLINAASWCDADVVSALIAGGADPDLPGQDGVRPIDSVCNAPQDRREDVLRILFAAGAGKKG